MPNISLPHGVAMGIVLVLMIPTVALGGEAKKDKSTARESGVASRQIEQAVNQLHHVGHRLAGLALNIWKEAELLLQQTGPTASKNTHAKRHMSKPTLATDVRSPSQRLAPRIGMVVNINLNESHANTEELDRAPRVLATWNDVKRSGKVVGMLGPGSTEGGTGKKGNTAQGAATGLPAFKAKNDSAAKETRSRHIRLADRMSAAELRRLILDLPGTFQFVDIRPPKQYADDHLPGSQNVNVAEVIRNPTYLKGDGPLIIVDRDGSLAMMVAGILSQKTERPIKALVGGLESYWRDEPISSADVRASPKN